MLRFLGRLTAAVLVLIMAVSAGAWYVLDNPNQLKPQLTALIEERTGVPVRIDGDLSWQLLPPLTLSAAGVRAEQDGASYELGRLELDVDLGSVLTSQDLNAWQIRSLKLTDFELNRDGERTQIPHLTLNDFAFDQRSPFATELTYQGPDGNAIPLAADGTLIYRPGSQTVELIDTRFKSDLTSGLCNLTGSMGDAGGYVDAEGTLIPVSIWRGYNWAGACLLDAIELDGERFEDLNLELSNTAGNSSTVLTLPRFFGGNATAKVDINAEHDPVVWRIEPDLNNVDSQALMSWLDQRLTWAAPLAYGGSITLTGNTAEELARSVSGKTRFDGGQGNIDISRIKTPLVNLAALLKEDQRIRNWPELWRYERFAGEWTISGTQHAMDLALDNLAAAIAGSYDPIADVMDMQIDIVFEDTPDQHSFDVSPLLLNLPIPLRCRGTLAAPQCAIDQQAAQRVVAAALANDQGGALRSRIEQKIDEDVPEQYRDAAKGLLDLFTRGAQQPPPDA